MEGNGTWLQDDVRERVDESLPAADSFTDQTWESGDGSEYGKSFHDPDKIVWVWIKDNRLTRVRLSSTWDTKLERRPGARLDGMISRVLQRGHARIVEEVELPAARDHGVELTPEFKRSLPRLNRDNFQGIRRQFAEIETRWAGAIEERERQEPKPLPVVQGRSHGVTVTLNPAGQATQVEIADAWLDDASTGEITTAVLQAAQTAYDNYSPPVEEPDAADAVAREHDLLLDILDVMLTPKEQR